MALIMFWGMFGFGEMVSSISFMGNGGEGGAADVRAYSELRVLHWSVLLWKTTALKLHLLACFITQLNMEFHSTAFFVFFYASHLGKIS